MDRLPYEIVVQITSFLDPLSATRLQQSAKRYLNICRDGNLWRHHCFETSSFLTSYLRRRSYLSPQASEVPGRNTTLRNLAIAFDNAHADPLTQPASSNSEPSYDAPVPPIRPKVDEKTRIMANWDPSYSTEKIDWYTEYVHRNAPIEISWLQSPRHRESPEHEVLEIRGAGTWTPKNEPDKGLAVAPLEDGSICLWDLTGALGKKGAVAGRSRSEALRTDAGLTLRSKLPNTGVVECVSIDNSCNKAYFAVESDLIEVDLQTLQPVSKERFPYSICAISEVKGTVPMTIGTNNSLHMHDPRAHHLHRGMTSEIVEPLCLSPRRSSLRELLLVNTHNYAPLFRPGPLAILHLETSLSEWDGNGDVYVCGRFPSILNFDRRVWPKLRGSIHSGARLCSMTSMPYSFSGSDKEKMRRAEMSLEQAQISKSHPGRTIITCGEYNSKGSLELYGLSPMPQLTTLSSESTAGKPHDAVFKNRQTSSSSKLLSVVEHGTRLVFSDGGGNLKWVERDGFTEVRKWNLARGEQEELRGIFGHDPLVQQGDIVRKILHAKAGVFDKAVNNDDLLLWTGEKLGMLSFSTQAGLTAESFEERNDTIEERRKEREERVYAETMRRALHSQADEVRFVRGLGLGVSNSF